MVGDAADDDEIGASIQGKENRRKEAAKGHGGKGGREGGWTNKKYLGWLVGWLKELQEALMQRIEPRECVLGRAG